MLYYTPEGTQSKLGLNFSGTFKGRIWFRLFWVWYNTSNYTQSCYYFRFCLKGTPHTYFTRESYNVIDSYLFATKTHITQFPKARELLNASNNSANNNN